MAAGANSLLPWRYHRIKFLMRSEYYYPMYAWLSLRSCKQDCRGALRSEKCKCRLLMAFSCFANRNWQMFLLWFQSTSVIWSDGDMGPLLESRNKETAMGGLAATLTGQEISQSSFNPRIWDFTWPKFRGISFSKKGDLQNRFSILRTKVVAKKWHLKH